MVEEEEKGRRGRAQENRSATTTRLLILTFMSWRKKLHMIIKIRNMLVTYLFIDCSVVVLYNFNLTLTGTKYSWLFPDSLYPWGLLYILLPHPENIMNKRNYTTLFPCHCSLKYIVY